MAEKQITAYFIHEAKTYRVRAGVKVKQMEGLTGLSRSTIGRIEGDSGVSEVNAFAYLNALKKLAGDYPHTGPFTRPFRGKAEVVRIKPEKL